MGGKTWSREEEIFFWRSIVPMSPKAAVPLAKAVDWEQSAILMQRHFGKNARRRYTKLMLFEHYFQNITTGHESPRASDLVAEHKRHLNENGKDASGIAAEHKKRSRRAAKRIVPPKAAVTLPNKPDDGAHKATGPPSNAVDGNPDGPGVMQCLPAYQLPSYGGGPYGGGAFYHGVPGASQGFGARWVSAADSGYVSAASPSSYGDSPAAFAHMAGDSGFGTPNTMSPPE